MLIRNNKKIVIPNPKILDNDYLLNKLVEKITKKLNLIPKFYKKNNIKNNYKNKICYILLTSISDGQKLFEEFVSKEENILEDVDKSICKVDLPDYDKKVKDASYQTTSVYGFGHPLYYKNVIEVLRGNAEPETDGREGLKSLEILVAAYLSAKDGKIISLPLEY